MGYLETNTTMAGIPSEMKDLAICETCGTQFDFTVAAAPEFCRMCLDDRQFVVASGQGWTSLAKMQGRYENVIEHADDDERVWSIHTSPAFAIGQRALLVETAEGNVIWDCVANLDQKTIDFIKSKGPVKAMAISHPHFYTSHVTWAKVFDCSVYVSGDEEQWINSLDVEGYRKLIPAGTLSHEILPGVNFVKVGGHFPGSAILHWDNTIFVGDTFGIAQSGLHPIHRNANHQVFLFHYAFPNFLPLGPSAMHGMWKQLKPWPFNAVHSLFHRWSIRDARVKRWVLESMQRLARHEEWEQHALLKEEWKE